MLALYELLNAMGWFIWNASPFPMMPMDFCLGIATESAEKWKEDPEAWYDEEEKWLTKRNELMSVEHGEPQAKAHKKTASRLSIV